MHLSFEVFSPSFHPIGQLCDQVQWLLEGGVGVWMERFVLHICDLTPVFLSEVENLLLVVKSKLFVSEYVAIANNTHVDGKLMSEDPLRVYLITLQDFVDGHEPELIAERSRRPSLGHII